MWPGITAALILLVRLGLIWGKPLGISVEMADVFGSLGWGEIQIRVWGWLMQVLIVVQLAKKTKSGTAALIAAANPWLNTISMWYIWETTALAAGLWGWAATKKWQRTVAIIFIVLALAADRTNLKRISIDNLFNKLNWSYLGQTVDEIQKINFQATGKTYMLPAIVRKILYNKPGLAINTVLQRSIALIDFEQWTAPLAAWTVTGLSGLPPKGLLPLIYYWDIPLLVFTIVIFDKKNVKWWLIGGWLGGIFLDKKFFTVGGILFIPAVVLLINKAVGGWDKRLVCILYLVGAGMFYREMFFNQLKWQYSDVYLFRQTAEWLKKSFPNDAQVVVTSKFGPMEKMLKFYGVLPNTRIEVGEFTPSPGKIYIGLPKELKNIPEDKIIKKIEADDELVYGYGKGLWIAKY